MRAPSRAGALMAASLAACSPTESGASQPESGSVLAQSSAPEPWFVEVRTAWGVEFVHRSGHRDAYYIPEIVAGGVALVDLENDGDLDLYLVQSDSLSAPRSECEGNRLYRNAGGASFEDVTDASGADDRGYGIGVATGDVDNDGLTDLYVTNVGANVLLVNRGDATFADTTTAAGVGDLGFGASAVFFDFDVDGDLDLWVTNYLVWSVATEKACFNGLGQRDYCAPALYNAPAVDVLYRNDGDGRFTDISAAAGLGRVIGTGLGVVSADFTADGRPDIFVANDGRPDQLWVNRGDGRFEDQGLLLGCAMDQDGKPKAGMGVAVADLDEDGHPDLLVCNLRGESDSLFLNDGSSFRDATGRFGLGTTSRTFTRFGTGFVDFDNDGRLDLYQASGRVANDVDGHGTPDSLAEPNLLFRGMAGGRFEESHPRGGTAGLLVHTSRGVAFGDLDGDGGVDLVVANKDAAPYVLRNVHPRRGHWLSVRVLDEHGRDALGATVHLQDGDRTLRREVRSGYSYCSASDPRVHFGLGDTPAVDELEVRWLDGARTRHPVPGVDRVMVVRRD